MRKREFSFTSADGKTPIHVIMWFPEGRAKGVVQIAHGVTEYAGRYEDLAEVLTGEGFLVICHDHLGHGLSISKHENKMYFESWGQIVSDFITVYKMTSKCYPDVPYFVMGFSMGSFVVREFLLSYAIKISGAIIMGTGYQPKFITSIMRKIVDKEAKKIGDNNTSKFIQKLSDGTYNSSVKNPISSRSWLLANEDALREYMNDPMIGGAMTAGLFREMLQGIENTCNKENVDKMYPDIPILLMSGTEDPVGNMTKGVTTVEKMFKKNWVKDIQTLLYPDSRHDILHEQVRVKVIYDMVRWLNSKV